MSWLPVSASKLSNTNDMIKQNETIQIESHALLSGVSEILPLDGAEKDLLVQLIDLAIGEIDYQDCDGVKYKHPEELISDAMLLRDRLFGNSR